MCRILISTFREMRQTPRRPCLSRRSPVTTGGKRITFSSRRGERVYSRKCAFHALLISSASYTECALYLPRANDGQTARPCN